MAGFILYEAWPRLSEPPGVSSGLMLSIALVAVVIDAASMWLLRDAQARSLNMRAAYLEVMGDLGGSAAVIVAAVVISLTGWSPADAVAKTRRFSSNPRIEGGWKARRTAERARAQVSVESRGPSRP